MIKKLLFGATTAFLLFAVVMPVYGGCSDAEIREDLRDIRSRIQDVAEDVEALLEGEKVAATFPRIPDDFRFPEISSYRYEDYGVEIMYMQIILNADPDTRLGEYGVGSPGEEVKRFGNITLNAVIKFQEKYASEILYPWGITKPTGIAAIQTQKKLNKILDGEIIIEVVDPEREAEIRNRIIQIIKDIQDLRRRLEECEDLEEGAADAPRDLRGAIIAYSEVRLTWKGDKNADYFTSYIADRSGGTRRVYGDTKKMNGIVRGLEYMETYYLTVTQTIDGEESGHSNEVRVTMDWPPTPFAIEAEATDIGELTLEWETDQAGVDEYYIYRAKRPGGPYTLIGKSDKRSFTDTGLELYTIYYYVFTQIIDSEESDLSGEYIDSWFYNWQGGSQPHPEKEKILDDIEYNL